MIVNNTLHYKVKCFYDEKGLSLKELLEDMYLMYIRGIKNG